MRYAHCTLCAQLTLWESTNFIIFMLFSFASPAMKIKILNGGYAVRCMPHAQILREKNYVDDANKKKTKKKLCVCALQYDRQHPFPSISAQHLMLCRKKICKIIKFIHSTITNQNQSLVGYGIFSYRILSLD